MQTLKFHSKFLLTVMFTMICLIAASTTQAADSIKGRVKKIGSTYLLVTKNQNAYTLEFTNEISKQQIQRLKDGDFTSVTANISPIAPSLIYVASVDYIGLNDLLGTWHTDSNLCYEFTSFTRMYVYTPNKDGRCQRNAEDSESNKYNYFINPDVDEWNMLISNTNTEFFSKLNLISNSHVEMELFDSQTDATLGTLILRR